VMESRPTLNDRQAAYEAGSETNESRHASEQK
jgi:hypothetical protein